MSVELWRQDDHGNRYLIGVFAQRHQAEERLRNLTRVPHKQTYWIAAAPLHPPPMGPSHDQRPAD